MYHLHCDSSLKIPLNPESGLPGRDVRLFLNKEFNRLKCIHYKYVKQHNLFADYREHREGKIKKNSLLAAKL